MKLQFYISRLAALPPLYRAFVETFLATSFCIAVVGLPFLPHEFARWRDGVAEWPILSVSVPEKRTVISLVLSVNQNEASKGFCGRIRWHDEKSGRDTTPEVYRTFDGHCMAVDPRGERLFIGQVSGALSFASLRNSNAGIQPFNTSTKRGPPSCMVCTFDSKTLVVLDDDNLTAWNIDAADSNFGTRRWHDEDDSIEHFDLSPDSQSGVLCCSAKGEGRVDEFDALSGQRRPILQKMRENPRSVCISPNGDFLAIAHESCEVDVLYRHPSHKEWERYPIAGLHSGILHIAKFSGDSKLLITSDRSSRQLVVWDIERKQVRHRFAKQSTDVIGCNCLGEDQLLSWDIDDKLQVSNLQPPFYVREFKL